MAASCRAVFNGEWSQNMLSYEILIILLVTSGQLHRMETESPKIYPKPGEQDVVR